MLMTIPRDQVNNEDPMLTIKELASAMRLNPVYLRSLVRNGKIESYQRAPGCQILIRLSAGLRYRRDKES